MSIVREVVNNTIKEIQDQNGFDKIELKEEMKIVNDLGFASLDVAQMIATFEMELGVDPFQEGVSLMDVVTIGDIYNVYQEYVDKKQG